MTGVRIAPPKLRIALLLVALATAGGITATIAQGDDPPSTASFKTVDAGDQFQLVTGSGSATSANIVTGGTVSFANSSVAPHNVDFVQAQSGVSCQQTVGGASASAVQFPGLPTAGTWAGVCTFTRAGTYSFMCDQHVGMTGTVVVSDRGAPPTTIATAPVVTATTPSQTTPTVDQTTAPASVSTPTATPTTTSAQTSVGGAKKLSIRVSLAQRGSSVRGVISGARSSARVKVALTARRGEIGLKDNAATLVGVGGLRAVTTKIGSLAFLVKLNGTALEALTRRGRLAITVRVTAPLVTGASAPKLFRVVVRPAGS
jgi:plastocyanin